jgi:hypothetical protein
MAASKYIEGLRDSVAFNMRVVDIGIIPVGGSVKREISHGYSFTLYLKPNAAFQGFGNFNIRFGDTGDLIPFGFENFLRCSGYKEVNIFNALGIPTSDAFMLVNSDSNHLIVHMGL